MSADRMSRESEKIFKHIWMLLPGLANCVWYPLTDSAIEYITLIRKYLDSLEDQLRVEAIKKKEGSGGKGGLTA